jgi:hypothetical protein
LFLKFTCISSFLSQLDMCMTAWVPCFMCVFVMLQQAFCDEDWIKGFIFLWSQSNYGGGQWQKQVSCLMVCPILFKPIIITLDISKEIFSLWCSVCNLSFSIWIFFDQGKSSLKIKRLPFMAVACTVMFVLYRTFKYQYNQEEVRDSVTYIMHH